MVLLVAKAVCVPEPLGPPEDEDDDDDDELLVARASRTCRVPVGNEEEVEGVRAPGGAKSGEARRRINAASAIAPCGVLRLVRSAAVPGKPSGRHGHGDHGGEALPPRPSLRLGLTLERLPGGGGRTRGVGPAAVCGLRVLGGHDAA